MSPDSSIEKQKGVWEESTIKTLHGGQELVGVACSLQQSFQVLFGFSPLCISCVSLHWIHKGKHRCTLQCDPQVALVRLYTEQLDGGRRAVCNSQSNFHPPLNFGSLTPLLILSNSTGENLKECVNIHQLHAAEF